jgi:hypothetical protein
MISLVDATRLCHGTDATAAVKRLLLRYGRKPLTMKDFRFSSPEGSIILRETFLGPKAAGRMPSLITWFDLIIIAGKGTTQQAKKFFDYMLRAEADSCTCALSAWCIREMCPRIWTVSSAKFQEGRSLLWNDRHARC